MKELRVSTEFIKVVTALGWTIRDAGPISSTELYSALSDRLSDESYQFLLDVLVRSGVVKRGPNLLLTWVGGSETDPETSIPETINGLSRWLEKRDQTP